MKHHSTKIQVSSNRKCYEIVC